MIPALIALITALVSYFASKKAGASDGQAAMIAAGAAAGSYYVATETEWGQGVVSSIEEWVGIKDSKGNPVLNNDGSQTKVPKGAQVVVDADGNPVKDSSGNVLWKLVDETGKVLTSWGPVGTAGVVATGAAASDGLFDSENLPWIIGGGLLAIAVLRS